MRDIIVTVTINLGTGDLGEPPGYIDWSEDTPDQRSRRLQAYIEATTASDAAEEIYTPGPSPDAAEYIPPKRPTWFRRYQRVRSSPDQSP